MALRGASKFIRQHGEISNKCNMRNFMKKVRETKAIKLKSKSLSPLKRHLVHLAIDSALRGACKRAGRELYYARKLSQK